MNPFNIYPLSDDDSIFLLQHLCFLKKNSLFSVFLPKKFVNSIFFCCFAIDLCLILINKESMV